MTLWIQSLLFFWANYINLSIYFFSRDIAKVLKTYYFGYFGDVWPLPSKTIIPTWYLSACKKWSPCLIFFGDIVKILQTYYFAYFENALSCPSMMIVSPCTKLNVQSVEINLKEILMFICKQNINYISNFFVWDIVKTLQTFYFGNFGNTSKSPSKKTASVCRSHSCLFARKNSTSSLTSFIIVLLQWNSKLVFRWAVLAILTTHT